jgi:pimeloyl-ACP methyl ester carboxylesterase
MTVDRVTSADGTQLAVDRSGSGPPLVIVVGAFCDRSSSRPLAALLDSRFTVYEYDRRGRGDSTDGQPWSAEREIEDLRAVIESVGTAPFVYGHSSGGILALEAAAAGAGMRKLVVYETPYTGDGSPGEAFAEQLDALVAEGRRDEAASRWLAVTGAPAEAIEQIRNGPGWPHMQALAHTLSRDLRLTNGGHVPDARFGRIDVETLALYGGVSAPWAPAAMERVVAAAPHAVARVVHGQHHAPAHEAIAPILHEFFLNAA